MDNRFNSIAVSYTHLDVYKRQEEETVVAVLVDEKIVVVTTEGAIGEAMVADVREEVLVGEEETAVDMVVEAMNVDIAADMVVHQEEALERV